MKKIILTLLLCLFLPSNTKAEPNTWPTFRGGPQNTGYSPVALHDSKSKSPPSFFSSKGIVWGTPVIDEVGNAYVGSADKHFYKFSPEGKLLWSYALFDRADSLVDSAAALTKTGKVIVPGGDGFLHALDRETGKLLWTFKSNAASDAAHSSGVIVNSFEGNVQIGPNGWIYAGSDNGYMYAVDDSGQLKWSFKTGMMIWSSPCFDKGGEWIAFGSLDGKLYLLDPATGKALAAWDAGSEVKSSPTTDGQGNIYVGTSSGNVLKLFVEKVNGEFHLKRVWSFPAGGEIYSSPAYNNGKIYFGSLEGIFYSVDEAGNLRWKYAAHSPLASSPLLTSDGYVLFGAKNGKMYALDSATGERAWSVKLVKETVKSNLDSSPALRKDGTLVNGSYSGNIYFLPLSYCAIESTACEFKGFEDFPNMDAKPLDNGGVLQLIDHDGSYHSHQTNTVNVFDNVQVKLFGFESGHLLDRAAASNFSNSVKISPELPIESRISSDGSTIDIRAISGFTPNTKYHLSISGKFFKSTSWLADRFKWFGLSRYSGELDFETNSLGENPGEEAHRLWGIQSMYLMQPKALDTYIPAALDGQGFLASSLGRNGKTGEFILLVNAALPSSDGVPKLVMDASNSFLLKGRQVGNAFRADGAMTIAAMGGTIPFKMATFAGSLDKFGDFSYGEFFTSSSCLDIKGNGTSYSFPLELIAQVCDSQLRLTCLGTFKGKALPIPSASTLGMKVESVSISSTNEALVTFSSAPKAPVLVSVVRYSLEQVEPTGFAVATIKEGKSIQLVLQKTAIAPSVSDIVEVFVNEVPVYKAQVQ